MGTAWQMPLAVIGKPTGDGRQFDAGALSHRTLPLPLRYVPTDSGGHNNAVIVGHISKVGKEQDGMLPAQGEFYDDDAWPDEVRNAATAARMFTSNKVIGPSVDLDQAEMEHVPEPKAYAAWKKDQVGKIKAAKKEHAAKTGSDCGCGDEPTFAEEAYDGPRLKMVRKGRFASATLVHIPAFAELAGHAKLTPLAEKPGKTAALVAGAMSELDWDAVEWDAKIENDGELTAEVVTLTDQEVHEQMAALMAAASPTAPPKEWFENPNLTGPTGLTITDEGRVFGHVAAWDTCHVGIGDSCVKPPKTLTSYAYFHTGEVRTAEGTNVAVGRLTYGGGHAAPNLGYRAAADHYDRTSATGAYVRAGEDQYGIWVAGMLAPDADENAIFKMRAAPLSGDWRRIGGNLEMVAALHVNTAGFPIPRVGLAASISGMPEDEEVLSLVAAGALARLDTDEPVIASAAAQLDPEELGRAIARGIRAEEQELKRREALETEWAALVAAAGALVPEPDYDDVLGGLLAALAQE